jgi:hypothetical protein
VNPQPVVYVGSWSRSGSTLLDLMLGQIRGFVSVGELRFLWERGLSERQLCGCGASVPECPFWNRVLEEVFGSARKVDPQAMVALWRRVDGLRRLPLQRAPSLSLRHAADLAEFREVLGRLYGAVGAVAGTKVVVDSSKYAAYAGLLAGAPGLDLRALHLVRDSRAVAYSWRRRKRMPEVVREERYMPIKPPWKSAFYWDLEHLALHVVLRSLPHYHLLRYDDLVSNPHEVLAASLAALGLPADPSLLRGGRLSLGPNHMVAGNPLRFHRGELRIRNDTEWREGLGRGSTWVVTALTWPLLARYGFLKS